jgi:hypothetical protein
MGSALGMGLPIPCPSASCAALLPPSVAPSKPKPLFALRANGRDMRNALLSDEGHARRPFGLDT